MYVRKTVAEARALGAVLGWSSGDVDHAIAVLTNGGLTEKTAADAVGWLISDLLNRPGGLHAVRHDGETPRTYAATVAALTPFLGAHNIDTLRNVGSMYGAFSRTSSLFAAVALAASAVMLEAASAAVAAALAALDDQTATIDDAEAAAAAALADLAG